ncbi:serine/threonine-protein kinase DCLK3-like isoform X2 [Physella acuta]|uniref:serine/threonine-protein kinase DCLK3-like isoform X2 n=1 Tax=Physella acuta TaxID=109671 RepID=UPI0027DBEFDE|nr:serine/threonine-protein kinase DCLK3-like isoform X2 [Physella acuta]
MYQCFESSDARPQGNQSSELEAENPGSYRYRGYVTNAFHPGRYFRTNHSYQQRRWQAFNSTHRPAPTNRSENLANKPKLITIVRHGPKPRNNIKILLNKRSVQSYEQLISDISEAFSQKSKNNKVQRLFGISGKEVQGVSDFFRNDNFFIALGPGDPDLLDSVVSDILKELFPEGNDAKLLLKEWERSQKRKRKVSPSGAALKQNQAVGARNEIPATDPLVTQVPDKKDSGFDSSDISTHRSEPGEAVMAGQSEATVPGHKRLHRPKRKIGKENETEKDFDANFEHGESTMPSHGYYMLKRMEKERMRLVNEERERFRKRRLKMVESERRAREEERRKRGLIPQKVSEGPFKKAEVVVKDDQEVVDKKAEDEMLKEKAELERKEQREAAERAARERMAQAEKAEKENQEKLKLEKEKFEAARLESERREKVKAEKEKKKQEKLQSVERKVEEEPNTKDQESNVEETQNVPKSNEVVNGTVEVLNTNSDTVENQPDPVNVPAEEPEVPDSNNNNKNPKEKRKQDREDKQQRKRVKTRIVRKTKEERQVGSDDYITQRYDLGRKLGDGNFAIVRLSRNKETGQEVAIKVIDKSKLKGKDQMVENEIDIMKDCSQPNIVRLYEEFETIERIYLVMELVKGGDLFDAITQSVKFGEMESAMMVRDVCNALFYLHSRSIVHRDLKPENLLVHRNKDGTITLKLADFGLAMEVKELIYTVCGTPTYVAPEILTEIGYSLEVDMWAVGVITYILLCGFPPFRSPDRNQSELFEFIKAGEYQFLSPYWDNTSRSAKDLISRLLIVDRRKRYTSVDVLCHRWVVCNGQTDIIANRAATIEVACKEVRKELEVQSKVHYENYQKLKEKKKRDREKIEE